MKKLIAGSLFILAAAYFSGCASLTQNPNCPAGQVEWINLGHKSCHAESEVPPWAQDIICSDGKPGHFDWNKDHSAILCVDNK